MWYCVCQIQRRLSLILSAFYFKSICNAAAHRKTDVTKKAEELLVKTFGKNYNEGKVIEVTQELQECQIIRSS